MCLFQNPQWVGAGGRRGCAAGKGMSVIKLETAENRLNMLFGRNTTLFQLHRKNSQCLDEKLGIDLSQ